MHIPGKRTYPRWLTSTRNSFACVALVTIAAPPPAIAETAAVGKSNPGARKVGVGLGVGHPTGVVARLAAGDSLIVQMGLGTGTLNGNGLHVHADLLWSPVVLASTSAMTVPFYVGGGVRVYDHNYERPSRFDDGNDTHIGLRVPVGIALQLRQHPIDIFFEPALVFDIEGDDGCTLSNSGLLCRDDDQLSLSFAVGGIYYF